MHFFLDSIFKSVIIENIKERLTLLLTNTGDKTMTENTAKQRMITSLENCIEEKSKTGSVVDQGAVMVMLKSIEEIKALNLMQCQKLENLIIKTNVELQISAFKNKWTYDPIHPMDYSSFIEDII